LDKKKKFLDLINNDQDIIHKICNLYADRAEDQRDLGQEIVYQLWKSYKSFKGQSKFTTWMYKVALNTALLNIRRENLKKQSLTLKEHHAYMPDWAGTIEKKQDIDKLYACINHLHKFDRAVVLLYLEEFSYLDISEIIGISTKNVSVRLVRIKKKLKDLYRPEAGS
jgi:RNA polymerase sigma-70 factor (ECF subfamily)